MKVSGHHLTGMDDYLERRANNLPLPAICEKCTAAAVPWAENRLLKFEEGLRDLLAGAERLDRMVANRRTRAGNHRRQAEEAEIEAARYQSSAERRELEDETLSYCQVVDRPARETSQKAQRLKADSARSPICGRFLCFQHNQGVVRLVSSDLSSNCDAVADGNLDPSHEGSTWTIESLP